MIRDSKYLREPGANPVRQPVIEVPASHWTAFLASVIESEQVVDPVLPSVVCSAFGVSVTAGDTSLRFTVAEWAAFVAGVGVGEFAA